MNIRTWFNICRFGFVLFILIGAGIFVSDDHWFRMVSGVATVLFVILGICGAFMGLKFAFSKLYFGCPLCNDKAQVLGGGHIGLCMDCAKCGIVKINGTLFTPLKAEVIEEVDEDEDQED